MGSAFSVADAYLFVMLRWTRHHKIDLHPWPALEQFQALVASRPSVQATLEAEGLAK
jgi:glutathione S-transferase